jgi:hypothetical protein
MKHFYRQRASPFQINQVLDIPIIVNKDIALMQVCKGIYERAMAQMRSRKWGMTARIAANAAI